MAVKIRLMRIGAKSRPFYRIVAVDERRKRTGGYLELIGTYNPLTEPKEIKIDQAKVVAWKKKGAVLSDGFLRIIGEAKQRRPRKTKKEKAAAPKTEENGEPLTADGKQPAVAPIHDSARDAKVEEVSVEEVVKPTISAEETPLVDKENKE